MIAGIVLAILIAEAQPYTWKGQWITRNEDTAAHEAPYFRKVFTQNKPVKKATVYVCGVGYHKVYMNGRPVTNRVLEQGYTRYDKRLLYLAYDVTGLLNKGNNCVAAELGNGWYNVQSRTIWFFDKVGWRKTPRLLLNIVREYTDGSSDTLVTDGSWKCNEGPLRFNSMHAGEVYDARREQPGWNLAKLDDSHWQPALVTQSPGGALEPQQMPGVEIIRRIKPVSLKKLGAGRWLFDMGQNFAGVATLTLKGRAGDTVTLYYDEVLTPQGTLDLLHNSSQMAPFEQYLSFQTDRYVLKGGGVETYTPRFTYHGFQYVEVHTNPATVLKKESLEGAFYSTGFAEAGTFTSSDTMLNRLYAAAKQSYRSNFISIPTDCPQREKSGWTADAHVACEMGLWNYASAEGYRKWLRDIRDVQLEDGNLPGIAPTLGRGYHWTDANDDGFGPAWASALPLITWYVYLYEADTAAVRENYVAIKKMVDRMDRRATDHIYTTGFGDWLCLQETPVPVISTAYFYTDARLLGKMAAILGNNADAARYSQLADSVRQAFHTRFFDTVTGLYRDSTVTAISAALFHGLCPDSLRTRVAASLNEAVIKRNYHADFGMLGTKYVLNALSDAGYATTAYKLLTDTGFAGWGNWMARGATTLYEDWKGAFSQNHVYAADYAAWYYKSLAGIRPVEEAPGFIHFEVHPVFPKGLNDIAVTHQTTYGTIAVNWQRRDKAIVFHIEVPERTMAHLQLPGNKRVLEAGSYSFTVAAPDTVE